MRSLINEAEEAGLDGDRQKALLLIGKALEKPRLSARSRTTLLARYDRLASLFFTEEGQKVFERAQALYFLHPHQSVAVFEEALRKEPGNILVIQGLAKAFLAQGECQKALEFLDEREFLPASQAYMGILRLKLQAQSAGCGTKEELQSLNARLKEFRQAAPADPLIPVLQAQTLVGEDKYDAALRVLAGDSDQKSLPERHYWSWRIRLKKNDPSAVLSGQRYLDVCGAPIAEVRRQYADHPMACRYFSEVKKEIEQ